MGRLINNVIRIPTSLTGKFFEFWLLFLHPFIKLTERELQVAACMVKHMHHLKQVVSDDVILQRLWLAEETRKTIMTECGISSLHNLRMIMVSLKKKGFLQESGMINPKFIPNVDKDDKTFSLLLHFELS